MMVLRFVMLALSYIAGIVLATYQPTPIPVGWLVAPAIAGGLGTVFLLWQEHRWRDWGRLPVILAAMLCMLPTGYLRTMQKLGPPPPGSLRQVLAETPSGMPLTLRGAIVHEPELRQNTQGDLRISVEALQCGGAAWQTVLPERVLLRVRRSDSAGPDEISALNHIMDPRAYGYRVEFSATYEAPRPLLNPDEFNFQGFLRQENVVARFRCDVQDFSVLEETRGNGLTELALVTKRHFLTTYKQTIRGPSSRLVAAATLGTRRALERIDYGGIEITEMFRHAGVGHVLAVSGLHVSVISLLLYSLFRIAGLRPRQFAPALIFCLVLFAILTGARPSSMRAVVMNSVILVAFAYFRMNLRHATYVGLALSALVILLRSPIILYAPSFLLSYGAVLSLVLISPVMDRWLRFLRGFSMVGFFLWFAAALVIGVHHFETFYSLPGVAGLAGLLWLLIKVGTLLNHRYPSFWRVGLDGLPPMLRMFFGAQLAIQFGMMIPMSAWFFGRFPFVGVLINLVAIPMIGILVQLGMLVGLLGLIPVVGHWCALPFGVTDTIVADLFFRLAHLGAVAFPFPPLPKPTPTWMVAYYVGLAAILSIEGWRVHAQAWLYRHRTPASARAWQRLSWGLVLCLVATPLLTVVRPHRTDIDEITCFALRRYPTVALLAGRDAVLINAGSRYGGGRTLFGALRARGATRIEAAIMAGPQPNAGMGGLITLAHQMPVATAWLPLTPRDPATFLEALGDDYVIQRAEAGQYWAVDYATVYADLLTELARRDTAVRPITAGPLWEGGGATISAYPGPSRLPSRFVSSAKTAVLDCTVKGFRWVILTESTPDVLRELALGTTPCHVLVLPDLSTRSSFRPLIDLAVRKTSPRVVILAGDRVPETFDVDAWARSYGSFEILQTARDGAVHATFPAPGAMTLTTHLTARTHHLTAH